jgi:hypothetical protein
LSATLPEKASDGLFLVWNRNANGWSRPVRLNAPQPWWCGPDVAVPGQTVRIFGRDLARRPDRTTAFVYLCKTGARGKWLVTEKAAKYSLVVRLPEKIATGDYEVWVHSGCGGAYGWGGPVKLTITSPTVTRRERTVSPPVSGSSSPDLQAILEEAARQGVAVIRLGQGYILFTARTDSRELHLSVQTRCF